ncbi:MAG: J domain-containing protein [Undibacterium sp.]|uniref:J domain-containing protein n=1 Tax=Undibacterium sp. TaxID=1914977 RepID=UPI0027160EFB|nr:J domain-containing protein [Undibacterium sp.]MDO8652640.1 J domain-containing protein [Undibacterium sp.]
MKKSTSSIVQVTPLAEPAKQTGLSRAQKSFNKLIKEIETERAKFKLWQEAIPQYQTQYAEQLQPLQVEFDQARITMLRLLDQAFEQYKFTKPETKKLTHIICDLAEELIAVSDDTDDTDELKAIYNKHSGKDFDTEMAEEDADFKAIMGEILGMELGDDVDLDSPADIAKLMQAKAQQSRDDQERQTQQAQRKKSKKTLMKEAQLQEEQKNITLSLREVYRKLVSSLHPDREPDAAERKRKTELMQRVNVAYEKQDLLGLLELQLEIEQIDQNMLNTLSEDRLKYFNKILTEQVNELKYETNELEFIFRMQANIPPHVSLKPGELMRMLEQFIRDARADIDAIEADLVELQELNQIKAMLKQVKITKRPDYDDNFLDDFHF